MNTILSAAVSLIDTYGDITAEEKISGLAYGDSVNIAFSNGCCLNSVPFYPNFYGRRGDTVLTDYFGSCCIAGICHALSDVTKVQAGDLFSISLEENGRYIREFTAYDIDPDIEKWDGQSDSDYMNARMIFGKEIREGILYRSASPFEAKYGRLSLMADYIAENKIRTAVSLSLSEGELKRLTDLPDISLRLIKNGHVIPAKMGIDFVSDSDRTALGETLKKMIHEPPPFLIHCSLGRDRTGNVCALLEALCGWCFEEIEKDFMETYRALHAININPSSLQYQLFLYKLTDPLSAMFGISDAELRTADLLSCAKTYLLSCGMREAEIIRLQNLLKGKTAV